MGTSEPHYVCVCCVTIGALALFDAQLPLPTSQPSTGCTSIVRACETVDFLLGDKNNDNNDKYNSDLLCIWMSICITSFEKQWHCHTWYLRVIHGINMYLPSNIHKSEYAWLCMALTENDTR